MRPLKNVVFVSVVASIVAGCAAIAGLGDLDKVDCTDDCDGGAGDGTANGDGADVVTGGDSAPLDSTASDSSDASNGGDTSADGGGLDTSTSDTGADAASDTGADAASDTGADAPVDSGVDAPVDSGGVDTGCGPIDTTTNCGACGATCTDTNATASTCGAGGVCSYTCDNGYSNCSMNGHNTDGCECHTPGCCSGACQVTHNDGFGETFYDCVPVNMPSVISATDACRAHVGANHASYCQSGFFCTNAQDASVGDMVCSSASPFECDCWGYDGMIADQLSVGSGPGMSNCLCPPGGTPWQ